MTEPESTLPVPDAPLPPARRSRLRRFFLRHLPFSLAGAIVVLGTAFTAFYFFVSSATFEAIVLRRLVVMLEESTGGHVQIASFHWRPLRLDADAGGLVIHGLEDPGEAPYAEIDHLHVRFSLLDFWSPRIQLRDLEITRPGFHLIVYPDGSTNQPHPGKPAKKGTSTLDEFFNLHTRHISVQQGFLHYENRSAAFDFQNRYIPLDFDASDLSVIMTCVPGKVLTLNSLRGCGSYRIEAGASDLNLSRGGQRMVGQPVHGYIQATLELTRSALYLRSLRLTSEVRSAKEKTADRHSLEISGGLESFAHPKWNARVTGELDLKLLDPVFGYPMTPEGVARLDLDSSGNDAGFRADGAIHFEGASYVGTGVVATGVKLDAKVHADSKQLLVTSIVARLRQGGQLEGELALTPWLPDFSAPRLMPRGAHFVKATGDRNTAPVHPLPFVIPMKGKVTAQLRNVSLDTLLDMVSQRPFQRLGLDALLNGPADATWSNGDTQSVVVSAALHLSPSGQATPGEVATDGSVDATYHQRDGSADLRKLELHTPASDLLARGRLGAYPATSTTAMAVDFHSRNLNEFDTVLRSLGLNRYGKTGTAALPVTLAGQMDFLHGTWNGSLVDPRIAGNLKATQLAIEMLPIQPVMKNKPVQPQLVQPRFVRWDSVEATGSYSAERIVLEHGLLRRGKSEIALDGTLDATPGRVPAYDANSTLYLHLHAAKVALDDVLPLTGQNLPISDSGHGTLDAQLQLAGPVHALGGSGWAELDGASVYGEPITRLRAQGAMAGQVLKLSSVTVNGPAGSVAGSGSYDINARRFQVDAKGSAIDISIVDATHRLGLATAGKLGFSVTGAGTLDDPRLQARATLSGLAVGGESLGTLALTAHTADRAVIYSANTKLESAEVDLHGQTAFDGDFTTHAQLDFSRFNIGALLELAHVQGLTGESALAGTVTVEGPLAHLSELRGEARLQQLAVTVAGVHLQSQGGVHATLGNSRITLDPLHITGEETDLRAQGALSLKDKKQLDFASSGSINLKLAETLDRDLTAGGTTTFQAEAHGPLANPEWRGRVDFQNGSLSLEDIPNGLSQLHGTLEFNQNRLEVKSLTAMSGGGLLSVTGYLAYQHGIYADLSVTGKEIRIRYPAGVSSLADATLRLQGAQNNLMLSGNVLITRFAVSQDMDIAALAAQANGVETIAPPDAPSNHIRLDVHLVSSPQLNFQNAYAKLAGDVDLHLRGTVASPSLLGRVSITEGSAIIAGTRYELQRGDIDFTNPVRIEPAIDLNATARVEDYDITLGLHGTPDKLAVTYRSDPPLPEADVVALLALGRTESQQRLYTQQQEQAVANPTTDALLGGALNATVSSRVQKLFGAGSVKVDPNYIGALGNSTSRITVEEQLGRNVTLTYATDVDTTGQQLIQAEVAINRHVSLLVARDESGVFSMVIKATRRYR
ncbi:MAG: translocation/assembly module TamB domain-containing protein [Terracidiphilus sp.]|jgi:translocation and assembly module TamB